MPFDFGQVLTFMAVSLAFVFAALLLARWVSPRFPYADKGEIYECGERPIGTAWFNFNPRFYIVALIFVVFDVEIALTFPVAAVFRSFIAAGSAWVALAELTIFVGILAAGLAYAWRMGDLEWLKPNRPVRTAPLREHDGRGSDGDAVAPAPGDTMGPASSTEQGVP